LASSVLHEERTMMLNCSFISESGH
jgi:hypothetical protein